MAREKKGLKNMRLFRRIKYRKIRMRRRWNRFVEKIIFYNYGITCSLPIDENDYYDEI
jgi:hypothetical protein